MTNCICEITINNCEITNCIYKITINNYEMTNCICEMKINNCEVTNCICKIAINNCKIDFALIYITEELSETAGKKKQQKNNPLLVKEIIFK